MGSRRPHWMMGAGLLPGSEARGPADSFSIRRLAARARRRSTARAEPRLPPGLVTDCGQIPLCRVLEGLLGILHDDLPELVRLECGHDLPYHGRTDGDVIGIASHEAHRFPILPHLQDVAAEKRA